MLFNRVRSPDFSIQVFVEPPHGLAPLVAAGGSLTVGTVSPYRTGWPFGLPAFSLGRSLADRLFRRSGRSAHEVVAMALALLPEIETWWDRPRQTEHILISTVRYPGNARQV